MIFLTFGFIMALTATRRAVLLLISLTAIAFFTGCLSFWSSLKRLSVDRGGASFSADPGALSHRGQAALFGDYDLIEVLCMVGYHGSL